MKVNGCPWCHRVHCNFFGTWNDHFYSPPFPEALAKYEDIYGYMLTYKRDGDCGGLSKHDIGSIGNYRRKITEELCFDWTPGQEWTCGCFPKHCHKCRVHALKSQITLEIKRSRTILSLRREVEKELAGPR